MTSSVSFQAIAALLFLLQFITSMNSSSAGTTTPIKQNIDFIRNSCGATTYPKLCFSSLSSYAAEIQTSPKLLASTALSVALENAHSTLAMVRNLSKTQVLKPKEVAAMRDCIEELSDSVYELQRSISEIKNAGGANFWFQMSDIQTWTSAALTDDDACMDGFSGKTMNGDVRNTIRSHVVRLAHLTSNALALVNNYASSHNINSPERKS